MDIRKVIADLQKELARIDEAIQTLERLREGAPRRGRPPGWLTLEGGAVRAASKKIKRKAANQK
jgi:hypothetical protein